MGAISGFVHEKTDLYQSGDLDRIPLVGNLHFIFWDAATTAQSLSVETYKTVGSTEIKYARRIVNTAHAAHPDSESWGRFDLEDGVEL